jgi:hypothetical protein
MKRTAAGICIVLFLNAMAAAAPGEERARFALGMGGEINRNTIEGQAGAGILLYDFAFNSRFSLGAKLGFSYNGGALGTLETELLLRFYIPSWNSSGPFLQAEGGTSLIFQRDDNHDNLYFSYLYGGALGWRLPLGPLYAEPFLRGGYPFLWGGGLIIGIRLRE